MLSLTKPTLVQQAKIAIQSQQGDWYADSALGSELHKVHEYKTDRASYLKLRQSLLKAVAHLPVELETEQRGSQFLYNIKEISSADT